MSAIEHASVEPDIVASAKDLAFRLPLSTVVAREEIMNAWGPAHTALPTVAVPCHVRPGWRPWTSSGPRPARDSTDLGTYLLAGLRKLQANEPGVVRDVRGIGLFIGIEFPNGQIANTVQNHCFEKGLLVLEAGGTSSAFATAARSGCEAETGLRLLARPSPRSRPKGQRSKSPRR